MAMRLLRRFFAVAALLTIALIGIYCAHNEFLKRDSIPKNLGLGWYFNEGACNRLLSYQGAYAISLTEETIEKIRAEGLKFLNDPIYKRNDEGSKYFTGEWKQTPVPESFHSEGSIPNLYCGSEYAWFWPKGIVSALDRPGSYYLGRDRRNLYVIPDLGLVVASGSDR